MARAVVTLKAVADADPAALDRALRDTVPDRTSRLAALAAFVTSLVVTGRRVLVRVDGSTEAAASAQIAVTQADFTAGDRLLIVIPGVRTYTLTATASGAVAANGEFDAITSDTVTGDNLAAAINAVPGLKSLLLATSSSGTVTITARQAGEGANLVDFVAYVTSGTPFGTLPAGLSGGTAPLSTPTVVAVVTQASLVSGTDALTIGNVTLTAQTSPSGENQWAIGASDTAAGDNLAAAINAHSKLQGIVSAVNAAGTVTVSWVGAGREAALIGVTEAGSGIALTGSSFAPSTTEAYQGPSEVV